MRRKAAAALAAALALALALSACGRNEVSEPGRAEYMTLSPGTGRDGALSPDDPENLTSGLRAGE